MDHIDAIRYNIVSIDTLAGLDWSVWGWAVLGTLNPFQDYGARLCWVVPGCVGDHERLLQGRKGAPLGWVGLGWLGLCCGLGGNELTCRRGLGLEARGVRGPRPGPAPPGTA